MPRTSKRQQLLAQLDVAIQSLKRQLALAHLLGISNDTRAYNILKRCQTLKQVVKSNRYLDRGSFRQRRTPKFSIYLQEDNEHRDALTDAEFVFHFRVSKSVFWQLVDLLKGHAIFNQQSSDSRGKQPRPASHQLLVLLKYYGSEGNGSCSRALSTFFGVGAGSIDAYRNNALEALLSLESQTYYWPTPEERSAISYRIKEKWLFPNCIGFMDGTLLPLATRPLLHGENYHSRKNFYAIVMLIVCDDQARMQG